MIKGHEELDAHMLAFDAAMRIFDLTKQFRREETYSLTDQTRRSSRSMCASIAEAWRKRRYEGAFICKLNDAETEAADTQMWHHLALACGYLSQEVVQELNQTYDQAIGKLVIMIVNPKPWLMVRRGTR